MPGRRSRLLGFAAVTLLIGAVLYFPIRRELLDRGLIVAGRWQSKGKVLVLYDNGRYEHFEGGKWERGRYELERFPEAPWISMVHLDRVGGAITLHVRYDDRVYRPEDIPQMESATAKYVRR